MFPAQTALFANTGTTIYLCCVSLAPYKARVASCLTSPTATVAVCMILAPHPSLLIIFVNYHYRVHGALYHAGAHLLATYTLTFLAFSSLIVVLARDPGPVGDKSQGEDAAESEEEGFLEALLAPPEGEDAHGPGKWCKKCVAPKPERAHHCGTCGRCVLKMGES